MKNLCSKQCPCGYEFNPSDIQPPMFGQMETFGKIDRNFYGGNVQKFSKAVCIGCGTEYMLYLSQKNGQWVIKDIAPTGECVECGELIPDELKHEEPAEEPKVDIKQAVIESILADLPTMKRLDMFALAKEKGIKINTQGKNEEIRQQLEDGLRG